MHATWPLVTTENITSFICANFVYKEIHGFKNKDSDFFIQFWKIAQEWTAISYNDYEMKFK